MSAFSHKKSQPPQRTPSSTTSHSAPARSLNHQEHPILNLQRTIGNQAVLRTLQAGHQPGETATSQAGAAASHPGFTDNFASFPVFHTPVRGIQRKLTVNEPGDAFEQGADRVADQVMRMPAPPIAAAQATSPAAAGSAAGIQRACACGGTCDECKKEHPENEHARVQMKATGPSNAGGIEAPPIVDEVLRSPGRPLDAGTRAFIEPRFGHDFGGVKVHTDDRAAESARAVQAKAYTVGQNVVFGSGEYGPGTPAGQRLLGHELTHVVQQGSSPGPAAPLQRKASKKDEDGKKTALKQHEQQQLNLVNLLNDARKISHDPSKGPLDPDNLYYNTVELIHERKILVSILTPTHDTTTRKPPELAYFDWHVKHPDPGGDYPADPAITDISTGLSFADPDISGETQANRLGVPGFVSVFTTNSLIDKDTLKKVLVHEAQHVADLHGPRLDDPQLQDPATGGRKLENWEGALEVYKSEFRAHWIQPVPPPVCSNGICLAEPTINRLASPGEKAENKDPIEIAQPANCTVCPEPVPGKGAKPAPSKMKTKLEGKRQEQIFQYLMSHYKKQQFACCYVYNSHFRTEVDKFHSPAGLNVINSLRLLNLNVELEVMKPTMHRGEVDKTNFVDAVEKLDASDWAFLRGDLSGPFWELLKKAPAALENAVKNLAKKSSPSASDVTDALQKGLAKLK